MDINGGVGAGIVAVMEGAGFILFEVPPSRLAYDMNRMAKINS